MQNRFKILSISLIISLLIGCGGGGGGGSTGASTTTTSGNTVSVYTLGKINNVVVTDSKGNAASYDKTTGNYAFSTTPVYPIKVKKLSDTYVDVDNDNNKTSNDILPKFNELKSYFNYIDLITDMHARAVEQNLSYYQNIDANDSNITIPSTQEVIDHYKQILEDKYSIDMDNPSTNEKILNFVAYDYKLANNSVDITIDLFDKYNNLVLFFNNYLNKASIANQVKYYSFFHSLELLDNKLVQRVDTAHKPNITYLHPSGSPITSHFVSTYLNLISKDIIVDDNKNVYVASGLDGIFELSNSLEYINNKKVSDTFSTSYNLDILSTSSKKYLLVADGGEGVRVFDITSGTLIDTNMTLWKGYDASKDSNFSISIDDSKGLQQVDDVISVKSYISPFENTIWMAFGTTNKGLYLIDFKKMISRITYPFIILDTENSINNNLLIQGNGGTVYSEAFSSDGDNLYYSKGNSIEKYDLTSLLTLAATPNSYSIKADIAYNLKMITKNGIDELFVSTNKGVEAYDVLNNGDLNFNSNYNTEGAQSGYLPKMSFVSDKNILLFTDGYKGIKAIKYDTSYKPNLCGVGYFSPFSDDTKLAKVNSVYSYKDINGTYYVLVGIEGFGIVKVKLDDLLFKHCL